MAQGVQQQKVHKRVVLIFLIAVLLPCLFLSYVGLMSIKQEKQWQKELVLKNLRSSLSLTVDRVESSILDRLRESFESLPAFPQKLTPAYIATLQNYAAQSRLVEYPFLVDHDLHLVFPRTYREQSTVRLFRTVASGVRRNKHLQNGEVLESRGQLEDAIDEFRNGLAAMPSPAERMALLVRLGRCQFKRNDLQDARRTYHKVIAESGDQLYSEEIPYLIVAYQQRVTIAERIETVDVLDSLLLSFYEMLVENFSHLDHPQFLFYLEQIKSKLSANENRLKSIDAGRLRALQAMEKEMDKELHLHALLQVSGMPEIIQDARSDGNLSRMRFLSFETEGTELLIAFQTRNDKGSHIHIVGFTVGLEALNDLVQHALVDSNVGEGIQIVLISASGRESALPRSSAQQIISTAPFLQLAKLLPAYSLALIETEENFLETLTVKSLLVYYILVFFIVALIAMGVVLIFRDISREERFSQMKSDFIANVSHEIKTPIATVRTLSENLNEGWVTDQGKQHEYFHLIARESERLSHLVENILDFSRIEAQRKSYRMELVPLNQVMTKAMERFRLLVDSGDVTIRQQVPDGLPQLKMDPEAIEQVLLNLLDNAVKYSRDEKVVELSVDAGVDQVVIKVSDRGCGIEKKDIQRVFEKFYRAESRDGKNVPGSGIGLTLVKEIIEAHGGNVEVQSELGRGSTFIIHLPVAT